MSSFEYPRHTRRAFGRLAALAALGAGLGATGALASTEEVGLDDYVPDAQDARLLRRISSLRMRRWQDHFDSISMDAILADTNDRVLHYWGSDGFYRVYPTSVPLNGSLTRRGRTTIVLKRPEPEWRPTDSMLQRNPALPRYVGPGPDNPLGIRALNLGFPGAYRIHGTNDIRKIGRQSSNGCIGLFNEHILEVYDRAQVGTPVLLI
ncbi:MAG TPA: L,D-transpeptidase [Amaricoccus sp.]|uniref:L,D-transpeptidase n=1 Tax=Amaricoccus sp. TaxID=1872485 RepID=UPI001DA6EC7E|nr:L,D-transpeptidase [Amaricoccus sp.]MCB1373551.1 L,D-transpeptidase [Paracoccaceae bacterium]MCB1404541.1 L,D-transpeptidase [Paracoccaceae bacterium]HPG23837.1 L,D-transpeptidase [Amaricoccus sp.]HRW16235.1 L,D-transpeptidase [Amaricoccus sp.]